MRGPTSSPEFIGERNSTVISNKTSGLERDTINRSCSTTSSNTAYSKKDDNDGGFPIWKVGKMLMDSLRKGKMRRSKIFGLPLEDLPLNCQGMPRIVQRLCSHLEQFGMNEAELFCSPKKQEKLVEKLKISFDRAGDADLEKLTEPRVIASLLKLWLQDLPHPLIPIRISNRLKMLFEKYEKKDIYDLNSEICNVLVTCPTLNLGVLYIVIRLLYDYLMKWIPSKHCDQLPEVFAKILIGGVEGYHIDIISTLMHNFPDIFNDRVLERAFQLYIIRDEKTRNEYRKRNHLAVTTKCKNSLLAVDKLLKSNSEEELTLRNDYNQNMSTKNVNMRRVNSHEDFTGHSQPNVRCLMQSPGTDIRQTCKANDHSMTERRVHNTYSQERSDEPVLDNFQRATRVPDKDTDVLVAPPPLNYNDDTQIQEEIRNAERFNPRFAYRNNGRRKRTYQGYNVKQKIPIIYKDDNNYVYPKSDQPSENMLNRGNDITNDDLPYFCGILLDNDTHSSSSDSSSSSSESNSSEHEPMQLLECRYRYLEPVISPCNRVFAVRHSFESISVPSRQGRRSYVDIGSVPAAHFSNLDMKISQINKHLQWIKRKMKRFEREFDDRREGMSVVANKIAHPEYKHMAVAIIYLKKYLKQLRKEASDGFSNQRFLISKSSQKSSVHDSYVSMTDKEKAVQEVEKRMHGIRIENKRPEYVEAMTHEQLQDEKICLEKELSFLENTFGQTTVHNEELFKPLYLRYRTVKRFLARSTVTLKLKESVSSDLVTIKENETMDFDNSIAAINIEEKIITPICQPICKVSRNDFPISNIHELSSPELMMEYKSTKEEKKKLRNKICMYKQEVENKATHNSKHCIHSLRCRYKNTKAKLKLLEALLMKTK